jgi:hypothetical protein
MSRQRHGLWLTCVLALALISPARVRGWAYQSGGLEPQRWAGPLSISIPPTNVDLDGDGLGETVSLAGGRAEIRSGLRAAWASPSTWEVRQAVVADLNRDGQPEALLLVWRPFQPWPIDRYLVRPGRIAGFHDAAGRSCHLILVGWERGGYREVWAGSAMADPFLAVAAADLDGDGRQELVALESDYADRPGVSARALSAWEWNGFGFTLLARAKGPFRQLVVAAAADGRVTILTQE